MRNIQQIAKDALEASEINTVATDGNNPNDFDKAQYLQEVLLSVGEDLEAIAEQQQEADATPYYKPNIKALLYDMHQLLEDMKVSEHFTEDVPVQVFKDLSFREYNRLYDIKLGIENWLAMHDLTDLDERGYL